jgi:hypothetical protein
MATTIHGTPTQSGLFPITIRATDANSYTGNQAYTLNINVAVSIITASLPSGTVNSAYNATISALGGTGNYTFSQTAGTLPTGVTLSTAGVLSGTPTVSNSYTFTIQCIDDLGSADSKSYTVITQLIIGDEGSGSGFRVGHHIGL